MSLTVQFYTMIAMIGMGSYFGAALDTYSRLFNRSKRNVYIRAINDILFWILQVLLIFYVLYLVNNGEIRFYIFLALLCGFAFYQSLLKNIYTRLLEQIIHVTIRTYRFGVNLFSNLLVKPIVMLLTFLLSVVVLIGKLLLRIILIIWKIIYTIYKIIMKPFRYLGKYIWKAVPKSVRIKGNIAFKKVANVIKWMINKLSKFKRQ
ncbi:spore cortex biosynthesis protein YabQ [Bacillus andreraoultii]|uniref:spore cortex biosynthesis protein YabQ n=1 Tax=Bacillus andreraoultii TaxID=1499685 RepID=UPI00053B5D39|nr:spore cortex biosynthesis protein YabQ [Bacillus andreraoultii]